MLTVPEKGFCRDPSRLDVAVQVDQEQFLNSHRGGLFYFVFGGLLHNIRRLADFLVNVTADGRMDCCLNPAFYCRSSAALEKTRRCLAYCVSSTLYSIGTSSARTCFARQHGKQPHAGRI
jgi:hypothetical protein